jgi:2-methylcitrate dehydratase PrpD
MDWSESSQRIELWDAWSVRGGFIPANAFALSALWCFGNDFAEAWGVAVMTTLSEQLAEWTEGVQAARLPSEVILETKLRILDMLGAMLAGCGDELATKARNSAIPDPGNHTATIIGFGDKVSSESAVLVNGVLAHVLEFDDTHVEGAVHPSSPVLASILSFSERYGLPGRKLLEAMLIGNEITCRLACVAPGMFHRNGFHPTGVFGAFGGAYALAHLSDMTPQQIANSVGIVGSMSAALMASWEDGADTKSLHAGLAALAANRAVALARQGISGSSVVFEGRFGFFRSHVQDPSYSFSLDRATHGLGTRWEVMSIASKVYPCGHYIQPFLDAAAALQSAYAPAVTDIVEIRCAVAEYMIPLICEPVSEKVEPNTSWHGRLSLQHSIAELLVTGRLDKRGYARKSLDDPHIVNLRRRVTFEPDPDASDRRSWAGDVTIRLKDGRSLRHRLAHMRGTPGNRLGVEDIVAKFRSNAEGVITHDNAERCIEFALALERLEDVSRLVATLAPQPS